MKAKTSFYKILLFLIVIFIIFYASQFIIAKNSPTANAVNINSDQHVVLKKSATNPIPTFWNFTEIERIPLNISIESTTYLWNDAHQKNYTIQTLFYTSQSWNNSPLRVYGALVFPDNTSGDLGQVPGIIAMHGLADTHLDTLALAYFLAAYNYTVLAIDFPGNGNSSGPPPTQEWLAPDLSGYDGNITADLLNQTHFYLTARAAIRGIDVLLNQSVVDPSRIAVTGSSYGGMNTMFASNIYGHKVRTAIPFISAGNIGAVQGDPDSFFRLLVNPYEIDYNDPPYSDYFQYLDPINYMNTSNNPPTLFFWGTNDEFFSLSASNATFFAAHNSTKAISMTPGGHHGWMIFKPTDGTFLYWLNYTMWNGPAPPAIQTHSQVESRLFGSKLTITVNVTCDAPISKVILASHWDVLGAAWKEKEMTRLNQSAWTIEIKSLPFNADLTYFVMVEIESELYVMFSTNAWRESLTTWLQLPFFILLGVALGLPVFLLLRHNIRKNKAKTSPKNERKLISLYSSQIIGISITEIIIAWSIFLPLAVVLPQSSKLEISIATILTKYIDLLPILTPILFGILIAGFILAFSRPILGGMINTLIPTVLLIAQALLVAWLAEYKDLMMGYRSSEKFLGVGLGVILMLACGIAQILLGVFKRKYQKRLS
jgi:pimeloyl-ACP methyl ester carboxylesterase